MPEELVETSCARHGVDRHVFVHEAGHAVAAIENDVPFRAVVIYKASAAPRFLGGLAYAPSAVEMLSEDASTWVLPNVLASLRFVMAGFTAEQTLLEHALPGGFTEDINAWRKGCGRTDGQSMDELDDFLGQPFRDVVEETKAWADSEETRSRIGALADHLGMQTSPFEMSYDEVRDFLAAR